MSERRHRPQRAQSLADKRRIYGTYIDSSNLGIELGQIDRTRASLQQHTEFVLGNIQRQDWGGMTTGDFAHTFTGFLGGSLLVTEQARHLGEQFAGRNAQLKSKSASTYNTLVAFADTYAPFWMTHDRTQTVREIIDDQGAPLWLGRDPVGQDKEISMYDILVSLGNSIAASPRSLNATEYRFVGSLLANMFDIEALCLRDWLADEVEDMRSFLSCSETVSLAFATTTKDINEQARRTNTISGGRNRHRLRAVLGLNAFVTDTLLALRDISDPRNIVAIDFLHALAMDPGNRVVGLNPLANNKLNSMAVLARVGILNRDLRDGDINAVQLGSSLKTFGRLIAGSRRSEDNLPAILGRHIEATSREIAYIYANEVNELFNWEHVTDDELPEDRGVRAAIARALNSTDNGYFQLTHQQLTDHFFGGEHPFEFVEIINQNDGAIEIIIVTEEQRQLRVSMDLSSYPGTRRFHLFDEENLDEAAVECVFEMVSESVHNLFDYYQAVRTQRVMPGTQESPALNMNKRYNQPDYPGVEEGSVHTDQRDEAGYMVDFDFRNTAWPKLRGRKLKGVKQKVGEIINNLFDEHGSPNYNFERIEGENSGYYRVAAGNLRVVMYAVEGGFEVVQIFDNHKEYEKFLARIKHQK